MLNSFDFIANAYGCATWLFLYEQTAMAQGISIHSFINNELLFDLFYYLSSM